jgi:diaminopimelate epimerase
VDSPPPAQPERGHIAVDRRGGEFGHIAVDKRPVPVGVDAHVAMRVYERGSGETLSCGSGAIAVAAVALRETGKETGVVAVDVLGGRLTISFDGQSCVLTGPAVLVATGETLHIG